MLRFLLGFLVLCVGFGFAGDSWAQKRIFLTPQPSGEKSKDSEQSEGTRKAKPRIFLRQDNRRSSVFVPPSLRLDRQKNRAVSRSKVFKNDYGIYRSAAFRDLNLEMLSAAGPVPTTADEIRLVAAAHRLPRVQALADMQRALSKSFVTPVRNEARKTRPVADRDVGGDERALVYDKPKPRVLPYRIFGR